MKNAVCKNKKNILKLDKLKTKINTCVIESAEIKNYHGIAPEGILLKDFSTVNYFVGENASGKTSVLNFLFEQYKLESAYISDTFTHFDIYKFLAKDTNTLKNIERLLKERIFCLDGLNIFDQTNFNGLFDENLMKKACVYTFEAGVKNGYCETFLKGEKNHSSGKNKLINLAYAALFLKEKFKVKYIFLDSVSTHLHPNLQKQVPIILEYLSQKLNIQFFITTHSPFIISGCSHFPAQKVYFLKDGKVAGKHGQISTKGSSGYWGAKVVQIAATMLGTGFQDIYSPQIPVFSNQTPYLVLCEGEGEEEDAKIYNIIFKDFKPSLLFASARGSSQLEKSYHTLLQVQPALSVNLKILMLKDRDHYFLNEEEVLEYESNNVGVKVLRRRAIEAYLFCEEMGELLTKKYNVQFPKDARKSIKILDHEIQSEAEIGVQGNKYKQELEQNFVSHLKPVITLLMNETGLSMRESLATLIAPETKIYQEIIKTLGIEEYRPFKFNIKF